MFVSWLITVYGWVNFNMDDIDVFNDTSRQFFDFSDHGSAGFQGFQGGVRTWVG